MLNLFLPGLRLDSQSIKAQRNTGGCFPVHTDSDVGVDGRAVTALVYLNPEWAPRDGGQLRLYPWPMPPVDVAPLNDRMVLFASKTLLHRCAPGWWGETGLYIVEGGSNCGHLAPGIVLALVQGGDHPSIHNPVQGAAVDRDRSVLLHGLAFGVAASGATLAASAAGAGRQRGPLPRRRVGVPAAPQPAQARGTVRAARRMGQVA